MDQHDDAARIVGRSLVTLVVLAVAAIAVNAVLGALGGTSFWSWLGAWLIPWSSTPGFAGAAALVGGAAAVIGAVIAYRGARRQAAETRKAADKAETWRRVQWAFDILRVEDPGEAPEARVMAWLTLLSVLADEEHTDVTDRTLVLNVLQASGLPVSDYLQQNPH